MCERVTRNSAVHSVLSLGEPRPAAQGSEAYAHSKPNSPRSTWHRLEEHLRGVAARAAEFAAPFGGAEVARIAGLWHDLGKYAMDFQEYLRVNGEASEADDPLPGRGCVDHSTAGAVLAMRTFSKRGLPVAFAIACHHSGLRNLEDLKPRLDDPGSRLAAARQSGLAEGVIADGIGARTELVLPDRFTRTSGLDSMEGQKRQSRSLEMFTRMVYSALVDADFLDTEAYLDPERSAHRRSFPALELLASRLELYLEALSARSPDTVVNAARRAILADCVRAAATEPGFFSLTVPTGGGKTYAALAFALQHALHHGLERVIVVAPYTSIIDQTVTAYRVALKPYDSAVLEHHAAIDMSGWTEEQELSHRLATENWDAPVVVTTAVQFFESLFARRYSRCRKLHRITRAVVVLDEAQTIPVRLLAPILDTLRELTEHYGTSIVFSTATQPALSAALYPEHRFLDFQPLDGVRELNSRVNESYHALQRVRVALPGDLGTSVPWQDVAAAISREPQALAIVGRRDDARRLAELVPESFHLSAAMCAAHRRHTLAQIRERLASGTPCRVVATSVVEAGVDVDFPVVFRALAGIDSLAQAAGRCNREGRLAFGTLHVFVPPSKPVRDLQPA